MSQMKMKGHWQQARGHIREAWGEVTDDDVDRAQGNWDQLVGSIRERTGEGVEEIEQKLTEILDSVSGDDESTETSG